MGNTSLTPNYDDSILEDISYTLIQAAGWQRLVTYILDIIAFDIVWSLFEMVLDSSGSTADYSDPDVALHYMLGRLLLMALGWLLYYFAMEALTGGRTIGKYLLGTRAVKEDGTRISAQTALFRTLIRFIPFEPFSALGTPANPWHDRWTKTFVVDLRKSTFPSQK